VKRADVWAHSEETAQMKLEVFDQMEYMLKEIEERGDCCSLKQLAISGRDLTALGYKGRQVGDLLNNLLQLVLEEPTRNNKAYLLEQLPCDNTEKDVE
jgi:tRNA nucleotidyltransferase (CCA-adding enzyme)